ncbi:uncharacterized protein LOC129892561, partial [Solanum dulcamara]|uniref:uncharacterized protein LOC129892561 n=1 Tax=Solanum dulcamara TaxID=45834 RepID=UPI00248575EE
IILKTSLKNLIHRHLLRPVATPAAASAADPFNISSQSQPSAHFGLQNSKSILTGHFSNDDKFLLNWIFVSDLPTFDLSLMKLRGSRSTSSKQRPDLEEDVEDDDEDDFEDDDDDDASKGFDDVDGSCDDSDDDGYGRRGSGHGGGSRGGGAYTA